jgi:hypothetical protein
MDDEMSGQRVTRHIQRCHRCGGTIKASEAYVVKPQLAHRTSDTGRELNVWTRPHFHLDAAICIKKAA